MIMKECARCYAELTQLLNEIKGLSAIGTGLTGGQRRCIRPAKLKNGCRPSGLNPDKDGKNRLFS